MSTVLTQIGTFMGAKDKAVRQEAASLANNAKDTAISTLRDGVPSAGDTLNKLYNLIKGNRTTYPVADNTAKDALTDLLIGDFVFVEDDGDTRWALYMCTGVSPSNTFVKVADPDTFAEELSAAQIKSLYESNANTNSFTDSHKGYLEGLQSSLASLTTVDKTSYVDAINEVNAAVGSLGTYSDFESAFTSAAS